MFAPVLAALVAAPFLAQSAAAASCARQYTIKEGDYCDAISAAQNVSTYQLATVNPSIDATCSNLQIDQVLCLGNDGEDCKNTYIVQGGDSCEGIQSSNNVNSTVLYHNNPQINSDCSNIYIGEVLCVGSEFAAPAPGPTIPATSIPPSATPANPPKTSSAVTTSIVEPTPAPTTSIETSSVETSSIETSSAVITPAPTTASSSVSSATPTATQSADDSDDEDDDDLPWCEDDDEDDENN